MDAETRDALFTLARSGDEDAIHMLKELGMWKDHPTPRTRVQVSRSSHEDLLSGAVSSRDVTAGPVFEVSIGDSTGQIQYVITVKAQSEEEAHQRVQSELTWMMDIGRVGWLGLPNPPSSHVVGHKILFNPGQIQITNITRKESLGG